MPADTTNSGIANSNAEAEAVSSDAAETTKKDISPVSRAAATTPAADKEELTADSPSINALGTAEPAATEAESTTKEADEAADPTPTKDLPVSEEPIPTTTKAPVVTTTHVPVVTTTPAPVATTTHPAVITTTQAAITTTQAQIPTTTKPPVVPVVPSTTAAAVITTVPVAVSNTPVAVTPTSVQNIPNVPSLSPSSIGVSFTSTPSSTMSLLPSSSAAPSTGGGTNTGLIGGIVGGIAGAAILIALVALIVRRKRRSSQNTRASRAMDEIFAPTSGSKGYGYSGNHHGNEEAAVGAAWESPRATERVAGNGQMATDYGNGGMGYDAGHQQGGAAYYDGGYAQQQGYEDPYRAAPQSYAPQLSEQAFNQASPALSYNNLPASAGPEMAAGGIAMTHLDHRYRQQDGGYYPEEGLQEPYQHVNRVNEHDYQTYQDSNGPSTPAVPLHDGRGMAQPMYADPAVQHQQYDDYQYNGGNYGHDNYYQEQPYDQHNYGAADQEMYGGGQAYQATGNPAYTSHPLPANPGGASQYNDYPQQAPSGYSQPAPKNNLNPGQSPA
ncbi:hypothetical protein CLU79DRAFT_744646 [Phycomyces nitens]|nr:hypothetical protein CLU79DRAFT_744646 [Phycomyces nitens]